MSLQEHQINISSIAGSSSASELSTTNDLNSIGPEDKNNPPTTSRPLKLPPLDLFEGRGAEYRDVGKLLRQASISSDWEASKVVLDEYPELVRFALTTTCDTALHIAASAQISNMSEDFVENLVDRMENEDMELQNKEGLTALAVAAANGSTKMVRIMLLKHKALATIFNSLETSSLYLSSMFGYRRMTRYLYDVFDGMVGEYWTDKDRGLIACHCAKGDMFDVALKIWTAYPQVATNDLYCWSILHSLAGKPDALNIAKPNLIWKIFHPMFAELHMTKGFSEYDHQALDLLKCVVNNIEEKHWHMFRYLVTGPYVDDGSYKHAGPLFVAAEMGNTRFVTELLRSNLELLLIKNDDDHTIFHIAIMHRHEGIYNLLYEIGSRKLDITSSKDKKHNNILHLVGLTSKKVLLGSTSGASLLMQRDLLWFQEVEKMMPRTMRDDKNEDGHTAYQLFTKNNNDLVSDGLKWTRDCMVAATLLVTVAFAVAFTIPGGYNQENGFPIFIHERSFLVVIIANAFSLFSSSTSFLVFLSILTSRYGQRDKLYALPKKLMLGLLTLFVSVASMMTTFAASFFVLYRNQLQWVPIVIGIFSTMPVIIFAALQFRLWLDMFRSMYDSRYLFNPRRRLLYNKNKRL